MSWFRNHLGASVSALVDGQLDPESTERAWQHVNACEACRGLVTREGWVKRQLAQMAGVDPGRPPAGLIGSLQGLGPETAEAWVAVGELEHRSRTRRRAGIAAVGVGSVSAAVLGLSTLGGAPLGIGGAPSGPPATSLTRPSPVGSPASASGASASPSAHTPSMWLRRQGPVPTDAVPVRTQH